MNEDEFRERYQRAFSSIHADKDFRINLEENPMKAEHIRWNKGLAAACTAAAIALGGATVYAQNIGGIQRKMQIWVDGELTTATVDLNEEGSYTIYDGKGNEVGGGGGVAYDGLLNQERPLTAEEMAKEIADQITLDESDGHYYLCWHNKKIDITDDFGEDHYAYLTLVDGSETLYVTINQDGSYSTSPNRYMIPGKDFSTR